METVTRNVRDLTQNDRAVLERVVGHSLSESEQIVIQVAGAPAIPVAVTPTFTGELPIWCNVYEGLTDTEVDQLDESISRSSSSREFP